ncbi:sensor histidine kinase [Ferrimonas senticii]|uniref:sensor histidine kinase n=1 Tax=Ferrimonas senticii TaxID=394566 RepID=UPI0003F7B522|nr:HAMP domain-containing sensor histidine kinase [Ferrimonas senticii]
MPLNQPLAPRQSSLWRLTLGLFALSGGTLVLALALLYHLLLGAEQKNLDEQLEVQAQLLHEQAEILDENQFSHLLQTKLKQSLLLFSWQGPNGMIGPFNFLPNDLPTLPQTSELSVLAAAPREILTFQSGMVSTSHGPVMVAISTAPLQRLQQQLLQTGLSALAVTLLLALLLGYLLARRQLRRLQRFNRLAQQVEQGRYDARLPVRGGGDELDQLAHYFNVVLDNLTASLATVQGISDNIAHDLRTPLTRMRLGLEQRLSQDPTLGIELEQLDGILATFEAMLALTKLEQGQRQLSFEPVELSHLIADAMEMLEPSAEDNQQQLQLAGEVTLVVNGDRYLLFQALFNLIDNAIKYAGSGATIVVGADERGLYVADNGIGVADHELEQLSQRLYRSDSSRHLPGFGLGLAMVRAICQAHDGQFIAEHNHPGLKITLALPPAPSL